MFLIPQITGEVENEMLRGDLLGGRVKRKEGILLAFWNSVLCHWEGNDLSSWERKHPAGKEGHTELVTINPSLHPLSKFCYSLSPGMPRLWWQVPSKPLISLHRILTCQLCAETILCLLRSAFQDLPWFHPTSPFQDDSEVLSIVGCSWKTRLKEAESTKKKSINDKAAICKHGDVDMEGGEWNSWISKQ